MLAAKVVVNRDITLNATSNNGVCVASQDKTEKKERQRKIHDLSASLPKVVKLNVCRNTPNNSL